MIQRFNVTWDLSRAGSALTCYWTERGEKPSVPAYRTAMFERTDGPWEPWQVQGIVGSVRAGVPLDEVCAGDRPRMSALRELATRLGDALFGAADRLTRGHTMAGKA